MLKLLVHAQLFFGEEHLKEYILPKVILVGNESHGKSSILENITKCNLFPRDAKRCTKAPIYVEISSGSNNYSVTYKSVKKIFLKRRYL